MLTSATFYSYPYRYYMLGAHNGLGLNRVISGTIQFSNICGNGGLGIFNSMDIVTIDTRNNWWGSPSGPDPYGSGNGINYLTYTCGNPPETCYDYEYYVDAASWATQPFEQSQGLGWNSHTEVKGSPPALEPIFSERKL